MKCPHCDGTGILAASEVSVGAMILSVRKRKGLRQEDVADRAGLTRAQIANIELGRSDTTMKTLAQIALALQCSMRDLMPEDTPDEEPPTPIVRSAKAADSAKGRKA